MTPSALAINTLESATVVVSFALLPLVAVLVWAIAAARVRAGRAPRDAWRETVAEVGAVAGTLPWLLLVLTPRAGEGAVQLVPLVDLADLASAEPRVIVEQLVGNLVLFAAAGFFTPIRFRIGLGAVAAAAAAGCAAVEAAQYLFGTGRVASVDDILLNTLGAVLAALASRRWWRIRSQRDQVPRAAELPGV
ncbi:VanZ family protein [Glycomyces tarimensis]